MKRLITFPIISAIATSTLLLPGCDSSPTGGAWVGPYPPHLVYPSNNLSVASTALTLTWSGSHPDNAPLTYQVFLGTGHDLQLVAVDVSDTTFQPTRLLPNTNYSWQITATDSSGLSSRSKIFRFSTSNHAAYPLVPGHIWRYSGESWVDNVRPDSFSGYWLIPSYMYNSVTVVGRQDPASSHSPFVVAESSMYSEDGYHYSYQKQTLLQNFERGLYNLGETGSFGVGATPRISPHALCLNIAGTWLTGTSEILPLLTTGENPLSKPDPDGTQEQHSGSPTIGDQVLAYPLHVGANWVFRANTGIGVISKKVVARVSVTVSAGTFRCYKIQWLYDGGTYFSDGSQVLFFDYISDAGLIKRSIEIKNVTLETYDYASGLIHGDVHTEFGLTEQEQLRIIDFQDGGIEPVF